MTLTVATFFLGLLWYRFSDHLLPIITHKLNFAEEPRERHWVVYYGLRRPECEENLDIDDANGNKLVLCLYFMLTTLSTVGYGDFFPQAISEKLLGSLVMIIGSSIFSMVMSSFI
jgi:hypothetical protein